MWLGRAREGIHKKTKIHDCAQRNNEGLTELNGVPTHVGTKYFLVTLLIFSRGI